MYLRLVDKVLQHDAEGHQQQQTSLQSGGAFVISTLSIGLSETRHGFEDITLLTRTDSSKTSRRMPLLCQDAEFLGRSAEQIEQGA